MYKLYIKINGEYKKAQIFDTYEDAKKHAKGEYLIIKREKNTDTIIEYNSNEKRKINDEWER